MKIRKVLCLSLFGLFLVSCASVKVIETNSEGGTLKFKRRGLAKNIREEKAMAQADEHCKRNGYKTYQVEKQSQDGRFMLVQFKCVN